MNRNDYMKRVLPVISQLGEEKTDIIMDKIAKYLVDAGEENEAAALNALGVPEVFARRFVHTDGDYEIPPFSEEIRQGAKQEHTHEQHGIFTHNEKMAMKPKAPKEPPKSKRAQRLEQKHNDYSPPNYDTKRMIIMLSLLIITMPIWLCFMAAFAAIALAFAFAVTAILLFMSVGGAALTMLGIMRLFSIFPVGLAMTGAGLLLLGLSSVAFLPLLKVSMGLLSSTVKDIVIFVKHVIRTACEPKETGVSI